MPISGRYKYNEKTGKVEKVSDRVRSMAKVPDWKRNMDPEEETRRGFSSLEDQGKLNQVDDKDVWQNHVRR